MVNLQCLKSIPMAVVSSIEKGVRDIMKVGNV
jgi:hypothetical protein